MTTFNVSSASQLDSALNSAKGGDTIELAGGDYGSLSVKGEKFASNVTITSANSNDPAVFSRAIVTEVTNLTFDGIEFAAGGGGDSSKDFQVTQSTNITFRNSVFEGQDKGGYGQGRGLWVSKTNGLTLENSDISGFNTGSYFLEVTGLTVRNNTYEDISLDGMIVGRVHDAMISGNSIDLHVPSGTKHTDGIQFWNTTINGPSTDVTIQDNEINTHNSASHGIYMANALAKTMGSNAFFQDVLIEGNTVVSGQVLGIAWAHTDGLDIRDNTVLQDTAFRSTSAAKIPVIRVAKESVDVSITGNTTHKQPEATGDNWQPLKGGAAQGAASNWEISNNKIVPLGTGANNSRAASASTAEAVLADDVTSAAVAAPASDDAAAGSSNGQADTFRFEGDEVGQAADVVSGIDFGEGDRIVLIQYQEDTFQFERGGNDLVVNAAGSYAKIDSIGDLRELVASSGAVDAARGENDTLILEIEQSGLPDHRIEMSEMANAYFNGYDASLF